MSELRNLLARSLNDPFKLIGFLWPQYTLYKKERELVDSVWRNDETNCTAGHMLGKDFTSALIMLVFFLTRHPCRIVSTSVDHNQLSVVLWGELKRHLQTSRIPLEAEKGGPLVVNHMHIRKVYNGDVCGLSYILGRTTEKPEGLSGHHIARMPDGIPRTLAVGDESSGIAPPVFEKMSEWAHRRLWIGNPYPCDNRFKYNVKGNPKTKDRGGDIPRENGEGYRRKVLRFTWADSPNVQYALAEKAAGRVPSDRILVPGVLPWSVYCNCREEWDESKQCVGLDGDFWEGEEEKLFPVEWLNRAEALAITLQDTKRKAVAIGCDPGQGGAKTAWTVADHLGIIEQTAYRTPNTMDIPRKTIALMEQYHVPPENVCMDIGGGGKQHADSLREKGFNIRTVAFGGTVARDLKNRRALLRERRDEREMRQSFKNRRSQMYWDMRLEVKRGWAIPQELYELRRQLSPLPVRWDDDGKFVLLPKGKGEPDEQDTMWSLLGCSPDEADSAALCVHAMLYEPSAAKAGSAW